jgi:hypothetical protein
VPDREDERVEMKVLGHRPLSRESVLDEHAMLRALSDSTRDDGNRPLP